MDKVLAYINKKEKWKAELTLLREILLVCELEETIKWGAPTYVYNNKNVVGLGAFKNYVGLWFFQGALLKDVQKVFINAQEGKTKAMLQWRFSSVDEMDKELIQLYVKEAIENVKLGKEIKPNRAKKELIIPKELEYELKTNKEFKKKFETLTNSSKREYADYISEAKKDETKLRRLKKIIPLVLNGKGLYDKYKNC